MAELFQKSKSTINEHIKNIYEEGELNKEDTMRKFGITELSTKPTNFYSIDVIISVVILAHIGNMTNIIYAILAICFE